MDPAGSTENTANCDRKTRFRVLVVHSCLQTDHLFSTNSQLQCDRELAQAAHTLTVTVSPKQLDGARSVLALS